MPLRCHGFAGIQKAVVDQSGSRSWNRDHDPFFGANLALGSALECLLSHTTELVIASCCIKSLFVECRNPVEKWSVVVAWNKRTLQNKNCFDLWSAQKTPTYRAFLPFWFTSNAKRHRMVGTELFGSFSCSCERAVFDDPLSWPLSTSDGWPLCSSSSRLPSPLQNFLNHHRTVHSLAVPGPNVLLMLWVVSAVLWPILNSNKKIAWICFFV